MEQIKQQQQQQQQEKWQGKVSATLPKTSAKQAWSLLSTFCNLHLWLPSVVTCHLVEGVEGQPGCVRYCSGSPDESLEGGQWAHEELLSFDDIGRSYTYKINENNLGFGHYVATFKVVDEAVGDDGIGAGCRLDWTFESEPVMGWSFEGLFGYLQSSVEAIAKRVEETLGQQVVNVVDC